MCLWDSKYTTNLLSTGHYSVCSNIKLLSPSLEWNILHIAIFVNSLDETIKSFTVVWTELKKKKKNAIKMLQKPFPAWHLTYFQVAWYINIILINEILYTVICKIYRHDILSHKTRWNLHNLFSRQNKCCFGHIQGNH